MNNNLVKRRSVFIKKGFQGRFIVGAFALIVLSGLCSALLIYWLSSGDLQAQSQSAHANIVNAWERLGISIAIGNVISILVAGGVAVAAVLYASHKIAGPLYRFESLCEQIGNGNLDGITHLREEDQLQELALAFADMVAKLRYRRDQQGLLVRNINRYIGLLNGGDNLTASQCDALSALADAVAHLNQSVNKS